MVFVVVEHLRHISYSVVAAADVLLCSTAVVHLWIV